MRKNGLKPTTGIPGTSIQEPIQVVVGVILKEGKVLISQRLTKTHLGGMWEFPGGKIEAGETHLQALRRELQEELSIDIATELKFVMEVPFHYPEKHIVLHVYQVFNFFGEPQGEEGQAVAWVTMNELQLYSFPAADQPILEWLQNDHSLIHPR